MNKFTVLLISLVAAASAEAASFVIPDDPYVFEQWGATDNDDGTVTFALHAPGKERVALIGDFNDWSPDANPMAIDEEGTWLTTIELKPGTYTYQYLVNSNQHIADPYSQDVTWKDDEGNETWIPEKAKTVLEVAPEPYTWTATNFVRSALDNLVVYEFHLEDLVGTSGGFTSVIDKLDYIHDLGFTAIEMLPYHEFPGDRSWGYNPAFHFAPETSYGTKTELKQLIDAAHERGLTFIMDLVLNHMDYNSALHSLYGSDYDNSPFFHLFEGDNWGFPDVDQESPAAKRYVADVIQYWMTRYNIDGIRYDATRFTGWNGYNNWGAGWFAFIGKRTDLSSIHIAEHMPSDPALINQTDMDTTWHDYFRWKMRDMIEHGYLDKNEFENIMNPRRIGFTNSLQRMAYTESHDEERVMYELKQRGFAEPERTRRCILALTMTLSAPGSVMIYAGQEFGEYTRKVVGSNPIQWKLLESKAGKEIYDATRKLIHLRTSNPALQNGDIEFLHVNQPEHMTAFKRTKDNDTVIVCANLGRGASSMNITFTGTWVNLFDGSTFTEPEKNTRAIELDAGEAVVFIKQFSKTAEETEPDVSTEEATPAVSD